MTGLWDTTALLALLLTWLAAPSSSLADASRREAVRRQLTQAPRVVLSNATLPTPRLVDIAPSSAGGAAAALGGKPGAGSSGEPGDASGDESGAEAGAARGVAAGGEQGAAAGGQPETAGEVVSGTPADTSVPTPEQIWRERAAALRLAIVTDAVTERDLESRVARLQREATSRDDPAQRAMLIDELARARQDLARAREKSRADAAAESAMREEARRADVPPGWLR